MQHGVTCDPRLTFAAVVDTQHACTKSALPGTAVVVAGDLQGYQALCTPHVAPQASAMLASLVQPSSKFSVAAGIAAQQGTLWHALSSVISLSSTSSTVRPKSHTLSPLQLLTPTAACTQGTGSNAISASTWSLPQICPTTQAALSQGNPKGWHQQHLTGMASLLSEFQHKPSVVCLMFSQFQGTQSELEFA